VDALAAHDVALVRAKNPGPFTLSGTNTWVLGRGPAYVVDPGPALPGHVDAVADEVVRRGGLGGIALTHGHADHAEAVPPLAERCGPAPLAAARGGDVELADGARFGPFLAVATPGHSPDHFAFAAGPVGFSGDAVLGEGSVYVAPDRGAMAGYLDGLRRLRALGLEIICPGHGPPIGDPAAKLDEYIDHRLDRERRLLAALDAGLRSETDLLDAVWDDVPGPLRPAAAITLRAHLGKLSDEGRAPAGAGEPGVD
jgi:glyoxylase-like metal-dependent hydrolase (beta-lactamase superfamily II)